MRSRRSSSLTRARAAALLTVAVVFTASGCETGGQGAVSGGAIGALGGLAIGSLSGNAGAGAAIGAISGAVAGGIIGDQNRRAEERQREMRYGGSQQ
ncbi:MAG: hypothetical protein IT438_08595 [Phycisphaerales bacterium]|nr:hypothetical protein [Phycisphaerales bacterium]